MCGIIGYTGPNKALPVLMNGLKRMEYRGYDSAGVALLGEGGVELVKRPGKIANLEEALKGRQREQCIGIGHTRWATHGAPSVDNAHPHQAGHITIVHNGIIENYAELKTALAKQHDREFASETDSEVLAHLIDEETKSDDIPLEKAVDSSLNNLRQTTHPHFLDGASLFV